MNQANLTQLVAKLPIRIADKPRRLRNLDGNYGRLIKLRKTVTALVRHERIELNFNRADEARGYAERLLSEAIKYGDCHRPTMDQAKFWLEEDPTLVPKLFKVLVPRYQSWSSGLPFTRLLRAPSNPLELDQYSPYQRAVLELRGNPYPPLAGPTNRKHPGLIHNVLLEEARKDYFRSQSPLAQQTEIEVLAVPDEDSKNIGPVNPEDFNEEENKEILLSSKLDKLELDPDELPPNTNNSSPDKSK